MEYYVVKAGDFYVEGVITTALLSIGEVNLTSAFDCAILYKKLDKAKDVAERIGGKVFQIELNEV